jgi:hypothetical protein
MNNPDHISDSLETIFGVRTLKFFDADPGFGMEKLRIRDPGEKIRIRDKHPESAALFLNFCLFPFYSYGFLLSLAVFFTVFRIRIWIQSGPRIRIQIRNPDLDSRGQK